jgi:hypothetical protein
MVLDLGKAVTPRWNISTTNEEGSNDLSKRI